MFIIHNVNFTWFSFSRITFFRKIRTTNIDSKKFLKFYFSTREKKNLFLVTKLQKKLRYILLQFICNLDGIKKIKYMQIIFWKKSKKLRLVIYKYFSLKKKTCHLNNISKTENNIYFRCFNL